MTSRSKRWCFEVRTSSVVHAIQGPSRVSRVDMSDMPMLKRGRGLDFDGSKLGICAPTDLEMVERMEMA